MVKKEEFYELHAGLCRAISNPKRLAIIDTLRSGSMNVNELSAKLESSQSNISQHLGILKSRGLVRSDIKGNCTYYHISDPKVLKAFDLVSEIVKEKFRDNNKMLSELIK
jgi:ArsR family transcriptional regulator, virulence genes transcriptional regulator